jgi:DNA processing protein
MKFKISERMKIMNEKELVRWFKLCTVDGLGPKKILKLFQLYKDINAIWDASDDELLRTGVFREPMIKSWLQLKNASSENFGKNIAECRRNNIAIIPIILEQYPLKLKFIPNPPVNLFLQGEFSLLHSKKVAIVGSRHSDNPSKRWAFDKAVKLAKNDIAIISGGARGIDFEAHKGTLSVSGKTICVMGTGLMKLYPEEHKTLFDEIKKNGLLISENLPSFTGGKIALLQRNRITSGLSDALIAVTCSDNGGSMTQLRHAYKQRIPIFCPKSSFNFIPSEGIKKVKREYKITEIEDITPVLDIIKKNNFPYLTAKQATLL